MNMTISRPGSTVARFGRRIAGIVAECDYAQRRMVSLQDTPGMYQLEADQGPADYPGFQLRASAVTRH
jgi:hypothetical protein